MKGATLLELLVFIVLTNILVLSSNLYISKIIEKRIIKTTAQSLETLMEGSFETSLFYGRITRLIKDVNGDFLIRISDRDIYTIPINNKYIINSGIYSSSSQKQIVFYPNGYSTPGRVELHSRNYICSLIISMRGRTRKVCKEK